MIAATKPNFSFYPCIFNANITVGVRNIPPCVLSFHKICKRKRNLTETKMVSPFDSRGGLSGVMVLLR